MSGPPEPLDEVVARAFDTSRQPLETRAFVEQVMARVRAAKRRRALWRIALWVPVAACAAATSPYVARGALAFTSGFGELLLRFADALASPAGWVASALFALWVLRRAKVFGR